MIKTTSNILIVLYKDAERATIVAVDPDETTVNSWTSNFDVMNAWMFYEVSLSKITEILNECRFNNDYCLKVK